MAKKETGPRIVESPQESKQERLAAVPVKMQVADTVAHVRQE